MSLSAFYTALLVPPANLVPIGLAGLALASFARPTGWRRAGRVLAWVAFGGLLLLSLPATSTLLFISLNYGLPSDLVPPPGVKPGAIVILSADAAHGGDSGIEPGSDIGAMTLDRMRAGAILARRTGVPVLTTGGALEDDAVPIAIQMADSLRNESRIDVRWIEPASADTWENAQFSAAILRPDGIGAVYLVTDGWHMRRSLLAFARAGLIAVPAPVRVPPAPDWSVDDFMPSAKALLNSYYALHEWIGYGWYRFVR